MPKKRKLSSEINKKFLDAVKKQSSELVEYYLNAGAEVNFTNDKGKSSLHIVAKQGDSKIFALLLKGKSANTFLSAEGKINSDLPDALPIHYAAYYGHTDILQKIIQYDDGETINEIDGNGFSPLHEAIDQEQSDIIKILLIQSKIDINIPTEDKDSDEYDLIPPGSTPLIQAIILDQPEVVKLLMKKEEIDTDLPESYTYLQITFPESGSALHLATALHRKEIVDILLRHFPAEALNENFDDVLEYGSDIETITPYQYAIENENEEIILSYVRSEKIANLNSFIDNKNNLLHLACQKGWVKILKELAKKSNVDFKIKNKYGQSIDKIATDYDQQQILHELEEIRDNKQKDIEINTYPQEASKLRLKEKIVKKRKKLFGDYNLDLGLDQFDDETYLQETYPYIELGLPILGEDELSSEDSDDKPADELVSDFGARYIFNQEIMDAYLEEDIGQQENMPAILTAVNKDPKTLVELLNFKGLNLELLGDEKRRAISYAKEAVSISLTREERIKLINLANDITTNIRFNNLKKLTENLKKYSTNDLEQLKKLAQYKISDKSVLEGYINFSVQIDIKKKRKNSSIITIKDILKIIQKIIDKRNKNINYLSSIPSILEKSEAINYIILQAAHAIYEDANRTDGEELDPMIEEEMKVFRKINWQNELVAFNYEKNTLPKSQIYIPIFRGINLMRDYFIGNERNVYEKQAYNKPYFASHSCFCMLGKKPHDPSVPFEELEKKAQEICQKINLLNDPKTVELFERDKKALRGCSSLLRRLQLVYTENVEGFKLNVFNNIKHTSSELKEKFEQRIHSEFSWFKEIFTTNTNPFVSGSITPTHPVRYSLGVSRAMANSGLLLDPQYDKQGVPKYPCVGVVYIALYPKDEYQQLQAINVPKAFARGEFKTMHHQLELLAEAEITITGIMKYIVVGMPIVFPNFGKNAEKDKLENFISSRKNYKNIIEGVKSKRGTVEYRTAISRLKKHLIKFYDKELMQIAINRAHSQNGYLQFELPDGTFTNTPPTSNEICTMAQLLSPAVKESRKQKLKDQQEKYHNNLITKKQKKSHDPVKQPKDDIKENIIRKKQKISFFTNIKETFEKTDVLENPACGK